MGLDITAYSHVKKVKGEFDDDKHVNVYILETFKEQADGLTEGCYEVCEYGIERFRAGSYSGYNEWRGWLASIVGKSDKEIWETPDPSIPFVELINFADNEGTIGPRTSKKLHADFVKMYPEALKAASKLDAETSTWYLGRYFKWMDAFELAQWDGFVKFH
jgi:hypothetical protein